MAIIKAAVVDRNTNLVVNVILVNDTEENYVEGCDVIPVPSIVVSPTPDEEELYSLLEEVDPSFVRPLKYEELTVIAGTTKWTEQQGFFE